MEEKEVSKKKKKKPLYIFRVLFIAFIIISLYVFLFFYRIINKKSIKVYEVTNGEISNVDRHKGMIYRDEYVAKCTNDGYINFFVPSGARVSRGSIIYTVNDTESNIATFDLNDNDINMIKKNVKMYNNNISDLDFSSIYLFKNNIISLIDSIDAVKQLENIDLEKEIEAKEKGYAKYAGLISFTIDGCENNNIIDFNESLIRKYNNNFTFNEGKKVKSNDNIYKIIKNPEFSIAFDSDYDYDADTNKNIKVKFIYDDITTKAEIDSFIGSDNKKHFQVKVVDFPEKFIDRRVVEFEIENRTRSGYKIPVKSIVSKNCYKIPKNMLELDFETNENIFYKIAANGEKVKVPCNISKEDDKFYYISIDDTLSNLKYGDVLTNRYNDIYSLSEVVKLDGVYNMNKGYAVFKNIDILDKTNEFAIIKKGSIGGVSLYDHIALNAYEIDEGDFIS